MVLLDDCLGMWVLPSSLFLLTLFWLLDLHEAIKRRGLRKWIMLFVLFAICFMGFRFISPSISKIAFSLTAERPVEVFTLFPVTKDGVDYTAGQELFVDANRQTDIEFDVVENPLIKGIKSYGLRIGAEPVNVKFSELVVYVRYLGKQVVYARLSGKDLAELVVSPDQGVTRFEEIGETLLIKAVHSHHPGWVVIPRDWWGKRYLWKHRDRVVWTTITLFWSLFLFVTVAVYLYGPGMWTRCRQFWKSYPAYLWVGSLTLILLFGVVIAAEFAVRYIYRDVLSTPSAGNYFSIKHSQKFELENNEWGYRGKAFSRGKKPGTSRVMVIGDSFTWGQGVYPKDKRFTEIVQQKLNPLDIEIVNLGVSGSDLPSYLTLLDFVLQFKPDYILYQWSLNDMDGEPGLLDFPSKPLIPDRRIHAYLLGRSALYTVLDSVWSRVSGVITGQKSYVEYLEDRFSDEQGEYWRLADQQLTDLLDKLNASGVSHGIVLFPGLYTPISDYNLNFMHDRVLEKCKIRNLACLDLRGVYSAYDADHRELWASPFDSYIGDLGHKLAGEEIAKAYTHLWLALRARRGLEQ